MSGTGTVSSVTLRQPASTSVSLTYEVNAPNHITWCLFSFTSDFETIILFIFLIVTKEALSLSYIKEAGKDKTQNTRVLESGGKFLSLSLYV